MRSIEPTVRPTPSIWASLAGVDAAHGYRRVELPVQKVVSHPVPTISSDASRVLAG